MTQRGTIVEGSTAWHVVEFFRRNPDEWLLTDDITLRWDLPAGFRVPQALRGAVGEGWLSVQRTNREPGSGGGYRCVYSAGPKILAVSMVAA
jgi:hypothetical protein